MLKQLLTAIGVLWLLQSVAHASELSAVHVERSGQATQLIFDFSKPVRHELLVLEPADGKPHRVVLDFKHTPLPKPLPKVNLDNTYVQGLRFGVREGRDLRVVLDLNAAARARTYTRAGKGKVAEQLVVDLVHPNAVPVTVAPAQAKASPRDILIAVDAGHGGADPGAIGPGNVREKDITLAISKQLVAALNRQKGYRAFLTREDDTFLSLAARRERARAERADLFISVHADAFTHKHARGASVFALSHSGATSETARLLAERENKTDLIGGVGIMDLDAVEKDLRLVLADLSVTANLGISLEVGSNVLDELGRITDLHKHQVEQARFAVLRSLDMPSILVETGFISNPEEARKLASKSFQGELVGALIRGISKHFATNPPPGSYLAMGAAQREYTITRGDTLTGIAARFNVGVNELMQHNGLSREEVIRVGQTLAIPQG